MPKNARALARLRKQQFDWAEQALAVANAHLNRLQERKAQLREQMRRVEPPSRGTGAQLEGVVAQRRAIQRAVEALESEIEAAEAQKREKERLLREAHIAWEQAKSIESQILGEILARQKRETANRLDEIASQKFWRDRNRREEKR